MYPGLTLTAGTIWWYVIKGTHSSVMHSVRLPQNVPKYLIVPRLVNSLNIPLSVETVCVFTAPIFSANASWATYLLTKVVF